MSDENRIRLIATQPIRGRILDKNGIILADSKIKYSLIIKPQNVSETNWNKYKFEISDLLDLNIEVIDKKYIDGLQKQKLSLLYISMKTSYLIPGHLMIEMFVSRETIIIVLLTIYLHYLRIMFYLILDFTWTSF